MVNPLTQPNGQTSFGTPQSYPGQQQPVFGNQPQYGAAPVAGQY